MFSNDLRIIEKRISLKNKFWNDLRIVEQKFVLQVIGRTKDIFSKSKLGLKCEFTRFGNLQIKDLDKWKCGWTSKLHSALPIEST
jgi:hypothetical protein